MLNQKIAKIESTLEPNVKRAVMQAKEKGASNWLGVIPLEEHKFILTKSEFRDSICISYDKPLRGMPSKCPCGQKFDVTHAINCKRGEYVITRHNKKPSALRFAFSACLFYNKQNFYCLDHFFRKTRVGY